MFLSKVECRGTETIITQCPSVGLKQHNCSSQSGAGVICGGRSKGGEEAYYLEFNYSLHN